MPSSISNERLSYKIGKQVCLDLPVLYPAYWILQTLLCVQNKSALFVNLFILASSVYQEYLLYYHQYSILNMQVESSATPVLIGDKAHSLAGQVCPFHPLSTLQLLERAEGFCYEHCPAWENVLYVVCPCFRMEKGHIIEWIAHHALWCETMCSSVGLWLFLQACIEKR